MVHTRRSIGSEPLSPGLPDTPSRSRRRSAPRTPASAANNNVIKLPKHRQLRRSVPSKSNTCAYLAYDARMALHGAADGNTSTSTRPERPERIGAIYERLMELEEDLIFWNCSTNNNSNESGVGNQHAAASSASSRFLPLQCRKATQSEIELVHTTDHYHAISSTARLSHEELLAKTAEDEESKDLVWNQHTFEAALLAAGGTMDCVDSVTAKSNECTRAISLCRPPGHHATSGSAMGFCYFNNVALAAYHALSTKRAKRIVILDWDIHHGNGTQNVCYDNEHILFISLHRYEQDVANEYSFYPGTGRPDEVGSTKAKGMNLNVAWSEPGVGDAEFAAALSELILPVISAFHPDLFLISAGFDAAEGDPIGDCLVSPRGYHAMTRSLLKTIGHDVPAVAVLEGGYSLDVIPACMEAVALALLDEPYEPALRDLVKADSLPREVLEELFGPIDNDDEEEEDAAAYDKPPRTEEQVERRQTMVRRGTTFGRQELLGLWRHPTREGDDADIEPRPIETRRAAVEPPRNVMPSAIQDINTSMRYLRNCEFWNDLWKMNIVDLHDIPEEEDVAEVGDMLGGLKI